MKIEPKREEGDPISDPRFPFETFRLLRESLRVCGDAVIGVFGSLVSDPERAIIWIRERGPYAVRTMARAVFCCGHAFGSGLVWWVIPAKLPLSIAGPAFLVAPSMALIALLFGYRPTPLDWVFLGSAYLAGIQSLILTVRLLRRAHFAEMEIACRGSSTPPKTN